MDPSLWQIDPGMSPPPAYDDLSIAIAPEDDEPLAIEAPPDEDDEEGEEDPWEANKILDHLELPNYNDVELRLGETEMTATKQRNYLQHIIKNAEYRRKQVIAMKSDATEKFKKGVIDAAERNRIHQNSDKFRGELNDYITQFRFKSKSIKGYGTKRQLGRGVYFYNDTKELLNKLTLIIGEMEAGNTSIEMRNMGVSILDTLLRSKTMNKGQYQELVKKYFRV